MVLLKQFQKKLTDSSGSKLRKINELQRARHHGEGETL